MKLNISSTDEAEKALSLNSTEASEWDKRHSHLTDYPYEFALCGYPRNGKPFVKRPGKPICPICKALKEHGDTV